MTDKVTLKIPKELYLKLKKCIEGTGFSSVTEFVTFTMRTIAMGGKIRSKEKFKKEEIAEIKRRLKKLGYL